LDDFFPLLVDFVAFMIETVSFGKKIHGLFIRILGSGFGNNEGIIQIKYYELIGHEPPRLFDR
jgi:hypothetical protein